MKQDLVIIGAGNVGGFLSYNINEFGSYNLIGFLDDDESKHGKFIYNNTVIGSVAEIGKLIKAHESLNVAIGIADPQIKRRIIDQLFHLPVKFPNLISKNCWISRKVSIGKGVILYPGVNINYETHLGDFVIANMNCTVGHNCIISNYSTLSPGVNLAGFTFLEEGVYVGIGATTIQNIKVGENAIIGGQTILLRDVAKGSTVVGNPGRVIR